MINNDKLLEIDQISLGLVSAPPMVRETILSDPKFTSYVDLFKTDTTITFREIDTIFQSNEFFTSIRNTLENYETISIKDKNNKIWKIVCNECEDKIPELEIRSGKEKLKLSSFLLLSNHKEHRISELKLLKNEYFMNEGIYKKWFNFLTKEPLSDQKFAEFSDDLDSSPIIFERKINNILTESFNIFSLIPNTPIYYENLVGNYNNENSIIEFANNSFQDHISSLYNWNSIIGAYNGLLVSSHSSLTTKMSNLIVENKEILDLAEELIHTGDRISQLGAIEILIKSTQKNKYSINVVKELVLQIKNDDVSLPNSGFDILNSLYVFVYGELSRIRLFSDTPPFYRKLVSFTHASLLQRLINKSNINVKKFKNVVYEAGEKYFYLQSLCDLREDPRVLSHITNADNLKKYFLKRIDVSTRNLNLYENNSKLHDNIPNEKLTNVDPQNIEQSFYIPDLIQGLEFNDWNLSTKIDELVVKYLECNNLNLQILTELLMLIFETEIDYKNIDCKHIKIEELVFKNNINKNEINISLKILALISAVLRKPDIAHKIRLICRKLRKNTFFKFNPLLEFDLCLLSSASYLCKLKWADFIGDWLTELSFETFESNKINEFYSAICIICDLEPELWNFCSKAEAALRTQDRDKIMNPNRMF